MFCVYIYVYERPFILGCGSIVKFYIKKGTCKMDKIYNLTLQFSTRNFGKISKIHIKLDDLLKIRRS